MKAVMEVATPMMACTPLGISSMYTPGYESVSGIEPYLLFVNVTPLAFSGPLGRASVHRARVSPVLLLHLPRGRLLPGASLPRFVPGSTCRQAASPPW